MPPSRFPWSRSRRRFALASLAAAALSAFPALAADRPATPEGADLLRALIAKYFPTAQAGASPLVTVTPQGVNYLISADLSVLNEILKQTGASYEPATIVYQAIEQDDGNWRLLMDSLPRIVFHSEEGNGSLELTNFRSTALISPAIAWLLGGSASMDKGALQIRTAKVDEAVEFGPVQESVMTTVSDGSVSTQVKEDISDISFKATGVGKNDAPVNVSGRADKALIDIGVDGFKSRKAFDLWGLLASHPARADLAAHEAELKGLLRELAAPGLKFTEGIEAQKTLVTSSIGATTLADAKYQLGAANAGPQSSVSLNVSAEGLSLPVGLLPAGAGDLTPSKIDLAATLDGVDLSAAANEWISDLSLQGDGPVISDQDEDKVQAALLSAGSDPARIRAIAYPRAGDRRRLYRRRPLRPRQARRRIDGPHAGFRQDDGGGQGAGPRRRGQGDARARPGQGAGQKRKRRQPQLAGRAEARPVDDGQRHPVRQGAGLTGSRRKNFQAGGRKSKSGGREIRRAGARLLDPPRGAAMRDNSACASAISGISGVGEKPSSAGARMACASSWRPVER